MQPDHVDVRDDHSAARRGKQRQDRVHLPRAKRDEEHRVAAEVDGGRVALPLLPGLLTQSHLHIRVEARKAVDAP